MFLGNKKKTQKTPHPKFGGHSSRFGAVEEKSQPYKLPQLEIPSMNKI